MSPQVRDPAVVGFGEGAPSVSRPNFREVLGVRALVHEGKRRRQDVFLLRVTIIILHM